LPLEEFEDLSKLILNECAESIEEFSAESCLRLTDGGNMRKKFIFCTTGKFVI